MRLLAGALMNPARQHERAPRSGARVAFLGDDVAVVAGVRAANPAALAALFDRNVETVRRVLGRVIGPDPEVEDAVHDTFVAALRSLDTLSDPTKLRGWLVGVAVFTGRGVIRRRARRRWLRLLAPWDVPEVPARSFDHELSEELRATYDALDELAVDERIAFSLRFIEGMELTDVAAACGVSLATVKRRLTRARQRFMIAAGRRPVLDRRLQQGGRHD